MSEDITYIPADAMRILVGVPIVTSNDPSPVISFFQEKIATYIPRLCYTTLTPQDVIFGYEKFWIIALLYSAPVLTIPHSNNLLAPLHRALIPKLRVMRTFPVVMRADPTEIGV